MRQPKNTAMIKATARERLIGRYGTAIAATLVYASIQILISDIVVSVVNPDNIATFIVFLLSVFLVDVVLGVFYSGLAYMYMNIIYAQPVTVRDIFHGFLNHPDKAIIIQLPFAITSALQTIPISVFRNFFIHSNSPYRFLLPGISMIGFIAAIMVNLVFALAFFLLQDFPDKSAKDILIISANLMSGNKMRLFKLYLSFIPVFLLGIVTLFIPLLWVNTYKEASLAAFYQDCVVVASQNRMGN